MASRTQIVCLCEGTRGSSIDEVFINRVLKALRPSWVRPEGSNFVRPQSCGGRAGVIKRTPTELKACLSRGSDTTLMVWADCDDNCPDPEKLKDLFWSESQKEGITEEQFNKIVFIFAKDRIENWIQFLLDGATDESAEGPRVKSNRAVADAAIKLASMCSGTSPSTDMPPSLEWSCRNWRDLRDRMTSS